MGNGKRDAVSSVVWLPEALADVARLRSFLEGKNAPAAARAAQTLRDGAKQLAAFPQIGRPMNDDTGRRELILSFGAGAYVLRYIIEGETVVILRAWHSKENRYDA